jgi:hypothetical protein
VAELPESVRYLQSDVFEESRIETFTSLISFHDGHMDIVVLWIPDKYGLEIPGKASVVVSVACPNIEIHKIGMLHTLGIQDDAIFVVNGVPERIVYWIVKSHFYLLMPYV